jgi:hypothetical protein
MKMRNRLCNSNYVEIKMHSYLFAPSITSHDKKYSSNSYFV